MNMQDAVKEVLEEAEEIASIGLPPVLRKPVKKQLASMKKTKGFRIKLGLLTETGEPQLRIIGKLAGVQLYHEASLIIDDIIDHTPIRRGEPALHMAPGSRILASCTAAWLSAKASVAYGNTSDSAFMLTEIAIAEALQATMKTAPRPIRLKTWKDIAQGDTGALFYMAAWAGDPQLSFGKFYRDILPLAWLYHGLDDVGDLLEAGPFAGGGTADLRDKVPTLMDCFSTAPLIDCTEEERLAAAALALKHLASLFSQATPVYGSLFDELRVIHSHLNESLCQRQLENKRRISSIRPDSA